MKRDIRVRGVRRKQIDYTKLAMAFMMLAKSLHERQSAEQPNDREVRPSADSEASQ